MSKSVSRLEFRESFTGLDLDSNSTLLIFDRKLLAVSKEFRAWTRGFKAKYAVDSGEELKDLDQFPKHAKKLAALAGGRPPRTLTVVAVGGGSVGDFAGFFASVYKRGVNLIHIPSTWLAAIDSSHGGKTALNNNRVKNQFGTFYPAQKVILVKSLLLGQPEERVHDAMGEFGKIALIDGGAWTSKLAKSHKAGAELLWKFLKPAIQAKLAVVARDPEEKTGVRQILNLGHTVGHVFETAFGWAHGLSIAQGLFFAIEFSRESGMLSERETAKVRTLLSEKLDLVPIQARLIPAKKFLALLAQDKKRDAKNAVTFIFLRKLGRTERVEVQLDDLLAEAKRQGVVG